MCYGCNVSSTKLSNGLLYLLFRYKADILSTTRLLVLHLCTVYGYCTDTIATLVYEVVSAYLSVALMRRVVLLILSI